ncbi:MAG: SHD1 domain-containing protein [Planctomycetota bacterium]
MNRFVSGILLWPVALAVLAFADDEAASATRLWTDASGRFKVQAELLETNGEKVILQTPAGRRIEISRSRLSEADRAYLKSTEVENENPFQMVPSTPKYQNAEEPQSSTGSLADARVLDHSTEIWKLKVSRPSQADVKPLDIELPRPNGRRQPHAINGLLMKAAVSDVQRTRE